MATENVNRGQKRTDSLGGKLIFQQGKNRIILLSEDGNIILLIGFQEGGF